MKLGSSTTEYGSRNDRLATMQATIVILPQELMSQQTHCLMLLRCVIIVYHRELDRRFPRLQGLTFPRISMHGNTTRGPAHEVTLNG